MFLFSTIHLLDQSNTPIASRQRGNECPGYDTKQSDGEAPVMLELWVMLWVICPALPSLPDPLWPGVVVPDRVLSIDQIELNCVLKLNFIG